MRPDEARLDHIGYRQTQCGRGRQRKANLVNRLRVESISHHTHNAQHGGQCSAAAAGEDTTFKSHTMSRAPHTCASGPCSRPLTTLKPCCALLSVTRLSGHANSGFRLEIGLSTCTPPPPGQTYSPIGEHPVIYASLHQGQYPGCALRCSWKPCHWIPATQQAISSTVQHSTHQVQHTNTSPHFLGSHAPSLISHG